MNLTDYTVGDLRRPHDFPQVFPKTRAEEIQQNWKETQELFPILKPIAERHLQFVRLEEALTANPNHYEYISHTRTH